MNGFNAKRSYKVSQLTLDRPGKNNNYTAVGKEFDTRPSARDFVGESRVAAADKKLPSTTISRGFEHSNYETLDFGSISSRSSSMTSLSSIGSGNSSFPYSSVSERAASPCSSVGSCTSVKSMKRIQLSRPNTDSAEQPTLRTCWSSMNNEPYNCDTTDDDDSVTAESCPGDVSINRPSSPHGSATGEFRTPSPARTVVGVYSHDSATEPQSTLLQKKRVISQAVFPHEQDRTLATPLLRLKRVKTTKLKCSGCNAIFNVRDDGQKKVQVNPLCWFCNKKRQSVRNRAKKTVYMSKSKENILIQPKPQKKEPVDYPIKRITREEYEREKAKEKEKAKLAQKAQLELEAQLEDEQNLKAVRQKEKPTKVQKHKNDKKESAGKEQPENERSVSRISISTSSKVRKPKLRTPSPAPSMERPHSSQSFVHGYEIIDATMIPPLLDSRSFTPVFEDPITQEPEPRPKSSLHLNYPKSDNYLSAPDFARPKSSLERLETTRNDSEFPTAAASKDAKRKVADESKCNTDCGAVNKLVVQEVRGTSSSNHSWNVRSEGQSSVSTSKTIYQQEEKVCQGKQATEVIAKRTEEVEVVQSVLRREVCAVETSSKTSTTKKSDLQSCKEMPLRNNGRVVIISRRVPARTNQNVSRTNAVINTQRNETGNLANSSATVQRIAHVVSERTLERSAVSFSSFGKPDSLKPAEQKPKVSSVQTTPNVVSEKKIERMELRSDVEKTLEDESLSYKETMPTVPSVQVIPNVISAKQIERTELRSEDKSISSEETRQTVSSVQRVPNLVSTKNLERTEAVINIEKQERRKVVPEETIQRFSAVKTKTANVVSEKKHEPQLNEFTFTGEQQTDSKVTEEADRPQSSTRNYTTVINFPAKTARNAEKRNVKSTATTSFIIQGDSLSEGAASTSNVKTSESFNDQNETNASQTIGEIQSEQVETTLVDDFVVIQKEDIPSQSIGKIARISRVKSPTPISLETNTDEVESPLKPLTPPHVTEKNEVSINRSCSVKLSSSVDLPLPEEDKANVRNEDHSHSAEHIKIENDERAHVEDKHIEKEDSKSTKMVKIQTKTSKTLLRDSRVNQPEDEMVVPPVIMTTPAPPSPVETLPIPLLRKYPPGMERTASPNKRVTFAPTIIQEDVDRPGSRVAIITTPKAEPPPVSETKIDNKMAPIQENTAPSKTQNDKPQSIPSASCRSPEPVRPSPKKKPAVPVKPTPKPPTTNKMVIIKTVTSRLTTNQRTDEVKEEIVKCGKAKIHIPLPHHRATPAPPVPPRRGASLNRVAELESKTKKLPSPSALTTTTAASVQRRTAPEKAINQPPAPTQQQPRQPSVFSARRATPAVGRSDNSASSSVAASRGDTNQISTTQAVNRSVTGWRSSSSLYGAKPERNCGGMTRNVATDDNVHVKQAQTQQLEEKKPFSFAHVSKSPKPSTAAPSNPPSSTARSSTTQDFRPVPPRRGDSLQKSVQKPTPNLDVDAFRLPSYSNRVCTPDISGRQSVNTDGVSVRITRVKTPLPGQKVVISNKKSFSNEDSMVGKEQDQTRQSSQSSTDEDCSGVVDGPNLKVKDIRAMFRGGPDYQDFAKPRVHIKPRPIRISSLSSLSPTEATSMNSPLNEQVKSPVTEQVMGLFREALEIQDKDSHATNGTTNGITNGSAEKRIPPIPPVRKHKVLAKQTSAQANLQYLRNRESQDAPPVKEDLRKSIARIKSESGQVESFEKSLDEFYDVFENLTS